MPDEILDSDNQEEKLVANEISTEEDNPAADFEEEDEELDDSDNLVNQLVNENRNLVEELKSQREKSQPEDNKKEETKYLTEEQFNKKLEQIEHRQIIKQNEIANNQRVTNEAMNYLDRVEVALEKKGITTDSSQGKLLISQADYMLRDMMAEEARQARLEGKRLTVNQAKKLQSKHWKEFKQYLPKEETKATSNSEDLGGHRGSITQTTKKAPDNQKAIQDFKDMTKSGGHSLGQVLAARRRMQGR